MPNDHSDKIKTEEEQLDVTSKKKISKQEKRALAVERSHLPISNTCRNCGRALELDMQYCHGCGAKRMYNRLNRRNLLDDFVDRFLNLEAGFPRTFIALFKRPEDVVNGYVNGVRKRYLSAFSYFAISLTLLGIYAFVFKNFFLDDLMFAQIDAQVDADDQSIAEIQKVTTRFMTDFVGTIMDYQSLLSFFTLPFAAFISRLVFWNYKQYNYIEHLVIYLYLYSHVMIISSVASIVFSWSNILQIIVGSITTLGYLIYFIYALKRIFNLSFQKMLLKTLLFLGIGTVLTGIIVVITMGVGVYLAKSGALDDIEFIKTMKELGKKQRERQLVKKAMQDSLQQDSIQRLHKHKSDSTYSLQPSDINIDSLNIP